jgi:hypothetical protein
MDREKATLLLRNNSWEDTHKMRMMILLVSDGDGRRLDLQAASLQTTRFCDESEIQSEVVPKYI